VPTDLPSLRVGQVSVVVSPTTRCRSLSFRGTRPDTCHTERLPCARLFRTHSAGFCVAAKSTICQWSPRLSTDGQTSWPAAVSGSGSGVIAAIWSFGIAPSVDRTATMRALRRRERRSAGTRRMAGEATMDRGTNRLNVAATPCRAPCRPWVPSADVAGRRPIGREPGGRTGSVPHRMSGRRLSAPRPAACFADRCRSRVAPAAGAAARDGRVDLRPHLGQQIVACFRSRLAATYSGPAGRGRPASEDRRRVRRQQVTSQSGKTWPDRASSLRRLGLRLVYSGGMMMSVPRRRPGPGSPRAGLRVSKRACPIGCRLTALVSGSDAARQQCMLPCGCTGGRGSGSDAA